GLTPRAVIEKLGAIQMIDVELPTTDGRTIVLSRHTEPEDDHRLLLQRLKLDLPAQPPPKSHGFSPSLTRARPHAPVVPTFSLHPKPFQR
ncbi:MAG TPA: IS1634 family transposase, partial [Roseiarcus sp.]|nr:IS1634 family transposase [Roseiarcus sp.]